MPSCPICSSEKTHEYKTQNTATVVSSEMFRVTESSYGLTLPLWRCLKCGHAFAAGQHLDRLTEYYEQLSDTEYIDTQDVRALQMRRIVESTKRLHPNAQNALDIGAGAGAMVAECQAAGLQATGIEPSVSFVRKAKEKYGVELIQGTLPSEQLKDKQFDIVFLIDIVEHVEDPIALLKNCRNHLNPGGIIVAVTPDLNSIAARLSGFRWWHFRVAHVGYFTEQSFSIACDRANLSIRNKHRAKWYFQIDYLVQRLEKYPTFRWIAFLFKKMPLLRRTLSLVIPLNLFDSYQFILRDKNG